MPEAPAGEYVVLQFKSAFENADSIIETVVPRLEDDGVWRVSGYFFRLPEISIADWSDDDSAAVKTERGLERAVDWLVLVDFAEYGASYDEAAALFKGSVSREDWIETVTDLRGPLGAISSRSVTEKGHTTSIPGAPPGEYVVVQFAAVFSGDHRMTEIVFLVLENGDWRVAGYLMQPAE